MVRLTITLDLLFLSKLNRGVYQNYQRTFKNITTRLFPFWQFIIVVTSLRWLVDFQILA